MVDMGVGQQNHYGFQAFCFDELRQLRVLERRLAGGIDDGALLRGFVDHHIAVNPEMVERKLLNH